MRVSKLEMTPDILDALQSLSTLLEGENPLERTLHTVVDLSVATLPKCDFSSITLRVKDKDTTAAASNNYTREIDQIQYETGQGPCLSALESGEPQRIARIPEETRWPAFCERAEKSGLRSSASFPLPVKGAPGSLNLYSNSDGAFDGPSAAVAEIFGKQAAIALQNASLYSAALKLGDQLNEALKTRDLIGQAKGVLMEREGITDDEAFEMLKTISQNSNVRLRDIAQRLVEERAKAAALRR